MPDSEDIKAILKHSLQTSREALLWKLDGLSEHDARRPMTPTGTNLLGIVKHMVNVEIGYFGDTFGRVWPHTSERIDEATFAHDPQADWYATADETMAGLIDVYRRVWAFADETIDRLELDASGSVPWWPEDRRTVTLGHVIIRVLGDLTRHTGQADILRESIDGVVGMWAASPNIPTYDWTDYVARLHSIADQFA